MLSVRASGVLCHISSLPSSFGVGDLGPEAYHFVDLLAEAGQHWWQVLPLNPTEKAMGYSPYSSFSAFAANPLFISPEMLVKEGFLETKDLEGVPVSSSGSADFKLAAKLRDGLFSIAYARYRSNQFLLKSFEDFCARESYWLEDYALFVLLKRYFGNHEWVNWAVEFRDRQAQALRDFAQDHFEAMEREKFIQYLFYRQWSALQQYCAGKKVGVIGDIPIYVNYDSVDVWVNPGLFKLDGNKRPIFVAGVPPDYFSKEGQRWGNPVYDWARLKETGFSWWLDRLRHNLTFFDAVRIDHFRAFSQCWEIPVTEKTAIRGAWQDVPGEDFFTTVQLRLSCPPIIAEDLGIITEDVDALKQRFAFPGMRVLMFAFHDKYKKSRDLPENYTPESIAYTGTHDNNTVRGWFDHDMTDIEKTNIVEYLGHDISSDEAPLIMIKLAMRSKANLAIIPLQDILSLGAETRMNRPSIIEGNWLWRVSSGDLSSDRFKSLAELTIQSGR